MDTLKERVWHGIRQMVQTPYGVVFKPVDAGIVPVVKALKKVGIPTTISCYGHMEVGGDGPYVEVESPKAMKLQMQLDTDQFFPISREYEILVEEIEELNLAEHRKLLQLIGAFYKHREPLACINRALRVIGFQEEDRLVVRSKSFGKARLESQGARFLRSVGSNGIRAKKLRRYRKEIEAFAAFLEMGIFLPQIKRS